MSLIKTAIYKKYANLEDYQHFAKETIESLKGTFPNVRLRPFAEFKAFLDRLLPRLVHKYILLAGTMKNCSGVSPDFAEMGAQAGFPVLVQYVPGHQRNVVLCEDGPYMVDLTYVQFTCNYDLHDPDVREEVLENYRVIRRDPFKAIKIEKLDPQYFGDTRAPRGDYDMVSPNPLERIEEYDIEEYEKNLPHMFDRFK